MIKEQAPSQVWRLSRPQNTEGQDTIRKVYDAIHGFIAFQQIIWDFIDTPHFQRLRKIKQLGTLQYVFPNANHTRFQHAIGRAHLARKFIKKLIKNHPQLYKGVDKKRVILTATLAGLLRDIAVRPYSHVKTKALDYQINNQMLFDHMLNHQQKLKEKLTEYQKKRIKILMRGQQNGMRGQQNGEKQAFKESVRTLISYQKYKEDLSRILEKRQQERKQAINSNLNLPSNLKQVLLNMIEIQNFQFDPKYQAKLKQLALIYTIEGYGLNDQEIQVLIKLKQDDRQVFIRGIQMQQKDKQYLISYLQMSKQAYLKNISNKLTPCYQNIMISQSSQKKTKYDINHSIIKSLKLPQKEKNLLLSGLKMSQQNQNKKIWAILIKGVNLNIKKRSQLIQKLRKYDQRVLFINKLELHFDQKQALKLTLKLSEQQRQILIMGLNKQKIGQKWVYLLKNWYFLDGKEWEILIHGFDIDKKQKENFINILTTGGNQSYEQTLQNLVQQTYLQIREKRVLKKVLKKDSSYLKPIVNGIDLQQRQKQALIRCFQLIQQEKSWEIRSLKQENKQEKKNMQQRQKFWKNIQQIFIEGFIFGQQIIKKGIVICLMQKKIERKWQLQIINNKINGIDVSIFDYFRRDAYYLGAIHTYIDHELLMNEARIVGGSICYPSKYMEIVNHIFSSRYKLHKNYFYNTINVGIQLMIREILELANVKKNMHSFQSTLSEEKKIEKFLKLNDHIFDIIEAKYQNIIQEDNIESQNIIKAIKLIKRIRERKLYKLVAQLKQNNKNNSQKKNQTDVLEKLQKFIGKDINQKCCVLIHNVGYGSQLQNPLTKIALFKKWSDNRQIIKKPQQQSMLSTEAYNQISVKIYAKNVKYYTHIQKAIDLWMKQSLDSTQTVDKGKSPFISGSNKEFNQGNIQSANTTVYKQ